MNIRTMRQSDFTRCPFAIMLLEHYRPDGTCRCDDPEHRQKMVREWGYTPKQFKGIPLRDETAFDLQEAHRTLSYARNMLGQPLNEEVLALFDAFFASPSAETWEAIHAIIILPSPHVTVWQAVRLVDPSFPMVGPSTDLEGNMLRGWTQVPSAETVFNGVYFVLR